MMTVLPPPETKAAYVEQMFARIAPGYDRMNRLMTLGLDQGWRQRAVQAIAPPADGRALDIGTGTGDFLPILGAWMPEGLVVGLDAPSAARVLGKRPGAVRTAAYRGLKRLAKQLGASGVTDEGPRTLGESK